MVEKFVSLWYAFVDVTLLLLLICSIQIICVWCGSVIIRELLSQRQSSISQLPSQQFDIIYEECDSSHLPDGATTKIWNHSHFTLRLKVHYTNNNLGSSWFSRLDIVIIM